MTNAVPDEIQSEGTVLGADGMRRCPWAASDPLLLEYHDSEWGHPVRGEQPLFERICLESFQAGLSWLTVLRKRPAFRTAFADFAPDVVAAFTDEDVERLLSNPEIIRNRAKIEATRANARAAVALREQGGLDEFLWSYREPDPLRPHTSDEVPTQTATSTQMARDLKARGFRFVGPTTCLALMFATGMVDAHLVRCHSRWSE